MLEEKKKSQCCRNIVGKGKSDTNCGKRGRQGLGYVGLYIPG